MRRTLGLGSAVALVMGNMIGSGVFLLPASLAPYRGLALVGWLVSASGSILLALVFADFARLDPQNGGPYAYCRRAFGDLPGFLVAWIYWLSLWCGNAAIAVAFVGYLDPFFPSVVRTPAYAAGLAIAAVWGVAVVNVMGVRQAGRLQVLTTVLKILPLAFVALIGLAAVDSSVLAVADTTPVAIGSSLFATVTLTMWAFTGLESATVPAAHVRDADRTIPRATVLGTAFAAILYLASTAGVMAILTSESLATTTAPFAEAARRVAGDHAALLVAAGAALAAFGALNGWTLVAGQLPQAAARDGLFPAAFARLTSRGTPAFSILAAAVLATALIAANSTRGLVGIFTFTILLSTVGALVPYAGCALAALVPGRRARSRPRAWIAGGAFVYALVALAGAGFEALLWGGLAIGAGVPMYFCTTRAYASGDPA